MRISLLYCIPGKESLADRTDTQLEIFGAADRKVSRPEDRLQKPLEVAWVRYPNKNKGNSPTSQPRGRRAGRWAWEAQVRVMINVGTGT